MTLLKLLAKTLTKLGDLKNSNAEGRPERPYKKPFTDVKKTKTHTVRNGTTDCKLKYYHHHYPFLQVSMTRRQELRKSEMEPVTGKLKYYQYHSTVGAFLQATSRVPRWWIGERPPDMAASCDIYK